MNNTSNISRWLHSATKQMEEANIPSARLDAELIMSHTLRKGRTYLHAHGDDEIDVRYLDILDTRLALRLDRVPLAYIIGHKEFYGRSFKVTPATLIPRPESEVMIDLLKELTVQAELPLASKPQKLVDVGTGSGCLGITAKLELPELDVMLTDTSRHALRVAEDNAKRLNAEVTSLRSDLLQSYPFTANYILANLPYVGEDWEVSPETRHEPREALYANNGGLSLIYRLLDEASRRITVKSYVFIEADPRQHANIIAVGMEKGFTVKTKREFILVFQLRPTDYIPQVSR